MDRHLIVLLGVLTASLPAIAEDKIYRSTDAEGNPVFSSMPTPDATEVDLPPTNAADAVEVRPPAPEQAKPRRPVRPEQPDSEMREDEEDPAVVVGDDDDWDVIYTDDGRERLRDRVERDPDRPQVNPRPPRPAPAGGRVGGRR